MKVIIAAGGKGTRIKSVASDIPKPLISIDGLPVLEREIISLRNQGFTDIILTVGYMNEILMEYFGDGSNLGVHIDYYVEEKAIGNAGALFKLRRILNEPFLFLIADAVFDIDFNRFVDFHRKHRKLVTLFTHPNSHPYDSSIIITGEDKSVEKWITKEEIRPLYYKNRVNAGIHIIDPKVLDICGIDEKLVGTEIEGRIVKVDLDRDLLKPLCGTGMMICYDSPEYCKDMGTPDRYDAVLNDFRKGVVSYKNLKNKQKAVFLDRDGTINKYVGFLRDIDKFELLPGVAEAIKRINSSKYLTIVVTNQPVVARGEVSLDYLEMIHNKMETELGEKGAYLDAIYYCPHHPDKGFGGEIPELKIICECRKPKPGMLINAARDFNLDLEECWMVGDSKNDIDAGKFAGCKTALIGDDKYEQDVSCKDLLEFVNNNIEL